jgi:hypothetical protein
VRITHTTTPSSRIDPTLAAAVDLARAAAQAEAGRQGRLGDHLGVRGGEEIAGAKVAQHAFGCLEPGYRGWYWAVEVVRVPRSKQVTVSEVVLLPGEEALLAPEWVPWSNRLRPGDVGVGDLLPTAADDVRLTLRQADTDGWIDQTLWLELGLGRPRVLSADGREVATERWYAGDRGPEAEIAKAAPKACGSCGFYVGLVGTLGRVFGVCANEYASDDGAVVSFDHGCGAHSEALLLPSAQPAPLQLDDGAAEPIGLAAHPPGSVDDAPSGEPGGHS